MSKMIQIRNVPDRLHRELTRRARRRGQTLTAYIEAVLEREMAVESIRDVLERIEERGPIEIGRPAADVIREARREAGRE